MSIAVRCPKCQADYRVKDALRGKRVKCKTCGAAIEVAGSEFPVPRKRRKTFAPVAIVLIIAFLAGAVMVGRSLGYFGGDVRQVRIVKRPLTEDERLARDRAASRSNLVRIGQALEMWARFHKGMYPRNLADVTQVAELRDHELRSPFGGAYVYLHFRSMGKAMPDATPVAYDAAEMRLHGHANVLFADGEVRWISAEEFEQTRNRAEAMRTGAAGENVAAGRRGE
jgi:predicted Zn finger-like uncharacterized protein/prepilin-type processing-associated H-X9-DG protein